ncbi:MAG: hypothetical protein K1V80_06925 [Muribaculaceae bacterium]
MNNSDFYTCKTVNLQKFLDSPDCDFEVEAAKGLAKAFSMWAEVSFFDKDLMLLSINISYVSDMVFSPDLLDVIKSFALVNRYVILGYKDEVRSVYEAEE